MKPIIDFLELLAVATTPSYGGTTTTATYFMQTNTDGFINQYEVVAEIRGIETNYLHFAMIECTAQTNNENTLPIDGITDLLGWM